MYDFPEHYGEVLNLLLDGSEAQTIPVSTWFMFINSLVPEGIHFVEGKNDKTGQKFEPGQSMKKLKVCFTQYATLQKFLSLADIRETILHLGIYLLTCSIEIIVYKTPINIHWYALSIRKQLNHQLPVHYCPPLGHWTVSPPQRGWRGHHHLSNYFFLNLSSKLL